MKAATLIILAAYLFSNFVVAQDSITNSLVVDLSAQRHSIPDDFLGLSFEASELLPDSTGQHQFSPQNLPLKNLLKTLGIRNLRFGGNMADSPVTSDPEISDFGPMFELAHDIKGKVIYTVRFTKGGSRRPFDVADANKAASTCRQILHNYPDCIESFTIGNEPNMYFGKLEQKLGETNQIKMTKGELDRRAYERYASEFRRFTKVIAAANPGIKFNGPSSTGNPAWGKWFFEDFANDPQIAFISNHFYPGGNGKAGEQEPKFTAMLSPGWHGIYANYLNGNGFGRPTKKKFRIEECNSFYAGGAPGVSDTFAASLWAVDYAYWLAEHNCAGVNFHTCTQATNGDNSCDYTSFIRDNFHSANAGSNFIENGYCIRPMGYALLMFHLGSMGGIIPLENENTNLNLSTYAVLGDDGDLYVTLINKESDSFAQTALLHFSIKGGRFLGVGKSLALLAPKKNLRAKTGVTLGGKSVAEDGTWSGKWEPLPDSAFARDGTVSVVVPSASALLVRLSLKKDK